MRLGLTARLIVTTLVIVAVVSTLIAVLATVAMGDHLTSRVDRDAARQVRIFAAQADPTLPDGSGLGGRYQPPGTLNAVIAGRFREGRLLGDTPGAGLSLGSEALDQIAELPIDGSVNGITIKGVGSFRVATREVRLSDGVDVVDGWAYSGMPTDPVDSAVASLIRWEAVFIGLGLLGAAGTSLFIVWRQLRPLREVAATAHAVADLPLDSGAIGELERVPAKLTDERDEVGQVGAALNTLLARVESSLEARHRSEQQVRQFVADASHELRTPLTTIRGYTELARSRPDIVPVALAKVDEQSQRMAALVEDLLLLARLDSGRPLESVPVDLTRIVVEAVADAQLLAPDHHWQVSTPEVPVEVTGDLLRLQQVVTNLVTNARIHTPSGTTVVVTVDEWGFSVFDDGPGIPATLNPFERFARESLGRTRGGSSGSGLGLALVQAIVSAHGGEVEFESRPGHTLFTVRLT